MPVSDAQHARAAELRASLTELRARIEQACLRADRTPDSVRLLAVTMRFPASDAALLAELGQTDLAENKDQEAAPKVRETAERHPAARPRWHMVGRLQRNKARSVVRWADEVQSVDSTRLVNALVKAVRAGRDAAELDPRVPLDILVQVSIDADPTRGGCPVDEVPELADEIARSSELRLRGLMTVAPRQLEPERAFADLARLAERVRADHAEATEISAGMSGDLEQAIAYGSTCVRVGTALLGRRELASFQ
jgi:PLP dependent protein